MNTGLGQTRIWHFAGDIFEWLESRPHVSGVQRVALQLMEAGCGPSAPAPRDGVCVLAPSGRWLAPVPAAATLAAFAPWVTPAAAHDARPLLSPARRPRPESLLWPGADELVLFAGLVWTPGYMDLFSRLSALGIRFGVLLHDIIPLQRPDLVAPGEPARFSAWLRTVLLTADLVFVSTHVTREAVIAWARQSGVVARSRVHVIPFGTSHLLRLGADAVRRPPDAPGDAAGFVLSVGTIDRRKNQAMLLRVWPRLMREMGAPALPVLVLAGRPNLAGFEEMAHPLRAAGKLVVFDGATDGELAWLYRHCLFTVFPSLREGYGIPVAESLALGKLCIASDLAEIREAAGDAVRTCDARSEPVLAACIRHGIKDGAGRMAVERRLQARGPGRSWADTLATIREAATTCERGRLGS